MFILRVLQALVRPIARGQELCKFCSSVDAFVLLLVFYEQIVVWF